MRDVGVPGMQTDCRCVQVFERARCRVHQVRSWHFATITMVVRSSVMPGVLNFRSSSRDMRLPATAETPVRPGSVPCPLTEPVPDPMPTGLFGTSPAFRFLARAVLLCFAFDLTSRIGRHAHALKPCGTAAVAEVRSFLPPVSGYEKGKAYKPSHVTTFT